LKLMVDANLSYALARSLQPLFSGHQVIALGDKFALNTKDEDWIKALDGEGGWAVVTADRRLKTRPHERLALERAQIVFFFLTGAWLSYGVAETAWRLIRLGPLMEAQSKIATGGLFNLPINAGSKLRSHPR
jgi:hypothetical protein